MLQSSTPVFERCLGLNRWQQQLTNQRCKRLYSETGPQDNQQVCLGKVCLEMLEETAGQALSKEDNVRLHQALCSRKSALSESDCTYLLCSVKALSEFDQIFCNSVKLQSHSLMATEYTCQASSALCSKAANVSKPDITSCYQEGISVGLHLDPLCIRTAGLSSETMPASFVTEQSRTPGIQAKVCLQATCTS